MVMPLLLVIGQGTGVTAEAVGTANLRSIPSLDGERVGEISVGTRYPVIGRSELYPWLLLGTLDTAAPLGWVFQDLVTITGNVNVVPFSSAEVTDPGVPATTQVPVAVDNGEPTATLAVGVTPLGAVTGQEQPVVTQGPTLTPTIDARVTGTTQGEINVRYGPGVEYQIVGRAFPGDVFAITGYHTQFPWVQVRYDESPNGFAWIANNLLEITGNVFTTNAISTVNFNLPTLTPTPAMRVSSNIPGLEPVSISGEFAALGDTMWNFVLGQDFVPETSRFGALYLADLQTGEALTYGAEFAFSGTSINKIAILLAYFGTINGTPSYPEARDIANTMICSENVATNRMLEVVGAGDALQGAEDTTRILQQLGLRNTFLTAPYDTTTQIATATPLPRPVSIPQTEADQTKANPNPTNQVTVEEMGWLLSNIYQCAYNESGPLIDNFNGAFTPQECRKMLYIMSENTVDGLLKAGVPANIRVSHKHGWINDTHGNAGVFFTPGGDYVMVMMLHEPNFLQFGQSLPALAETSRMVYNYYNPAQPLDVVREGFIPEVDQCNYTAADPIVDNLASSSFLLFNDTNLFYQGNAATPEPSGPTLTPTLRPTWTPDSFGTGG